MGSPSDDTQTATGKITVLGIIDNEQYRDRVYNMVRQIPMGRVMTYGQIAIILGEGYTARTVGYVMHGSPNDVPWQRVINSQGRCSTGRLILPVNLQQEMLEAEGVVFNDRGKCALAVFQWHPEGLEYDRDDDRVILFRGDRPR